MIAAALLFAATAIAVDTGVSVDTGIAVDVAASIDLVSDYRWRGASLSGGAPAIQGAVEISHRSGAWAELWATSLPRRLGSAEVDVGAGWSWDAHGTGLSLGARAYLYPSLQDADYAEATAAVSRVFAGTGVEVTAGVAWAPKQRNLARDDLYLSADVEAPLIDDTLRLIAHGGWERGPFGLTRTKWDWSAGLAYTKGPVTVSATYVDTDEPSARDTDRAFSPTVMAGVSFGF